MDRFDDDDEAVLYYAEETAAKGWSRALLTNAINLEMHKHHALLQKPIGVTDYRLIIPQEELRQLVQKEIEEFSQPK